MSINKLRKEVEKTNIEALVGDITKTTEIKKGSIELVYENHDVNTPPFKAGMVYLSTVFHIFSDAQVVGFEKEVKRILSPRAKLAIINIKKEDTPFGPPVEMRSSPEELRQKLSFAPGKLIEVSEHFYMQLFNNI